LVLRDIALATELHESTVSRVTSNKYIATPRGLFELKYFFTSSLPARTPGSVVSSEAVRSRIRHLVGSESARQPLSDDRIVELLKGEGIEIARRTVAKYREALRIPSSAERRRLGRLGIGRSVAAGLTPAVVAAQAATGPADWAPERSRPADLTAPEEALIGAHLTPDEQGVPVANLLVVLLKLPICCLARMLSWLV
jgi:RNA polymerase sigma-54 factor